MTPLEEFEDTIHVSKVALLLSGVNLYCQNNDSFKTSWRDFITFYVNTFLLHLLLTAEIYFAVDAISKGGSFIEYSTMMPCLSISLLGSIKVCFLYKDNCIVLETVNKLKKLHIKVYNEREFIEIGDIKKAEEDKLAKDRVKLLKRYVTILIGTGGGVCTMFVLAPLTLMIIGYKKNGYLEVQFPFLVKYFFDVYEPPYWYMEYLHHVSTTYIVFINVLGTDSLFYTFCTYIEIHFKLLCSKLENISASSKVETKENFAECVKRHQELIYLVDQIESIHTYAMLGNIIISSLLICFSAFYLTVSEDFNLCVTFFLFLLTSLSQIFFICYYSDNLMQASSEVSEAIYKCKWYEFDESTKKGIVLVLLRSQNPCKLTAANFTDLNLNAFTNILSRSWSLFALLRTVYN